MGYYNRQGQAIGMQEWSDALSRDQRVTETTLPNGYWVSTVYLGLDHRFGGGGAPLIFETMVFPCDALGKVTGWGELDSDRYSTEDEARAGHERIRAAWATKPQSFAEAQSVSNTPSEDPPGNATVSEVK